MDTISNKSSSIVSTIKDWEAKREEEVNKKLFETDPQERLRIDDNIKTIDDMIAKKFAILSKLNEVDKTLPDAVLKSPRLVVDEVDPATDLPSAQVTPVSVENNNSFELFCTHSDSMPELTEAKKQKIKEKNENDKLEEQKRFDETYHRHYNNYALTAHYFEVLNDCDHYDKNGNKLPPINPALVVANDIEASKILEKPDGIRLICQHDEERKAQDIHGNWDIDTTSAKKRFTYFNSYKDLYPYLIYLNDNDKKKMSKTNGKTYYHTRCMYETINGNYKLKAYFDIDINKYQYPNINDQEFLNNFVKNLYTVFYQYYKIELDFFKDILVCSSHGTSKYSYHIIIDNYYFNNYTEVATLFKLIKMRMDPKFTTPTQQRDETTGEFKVNAKKEPILNSPIMDPNVYRKLGQFRLLYCSKKYTTRFKKLELKWTYDGCTIQRRDFGPELNLRATLVGYTQNCVLATLQEELPETLIVKKYNGSIYLEDVNDDDMQFAVDAVKDYYRKHDYIFDTSHVLEKENGLISFKNVQHNHFCFGCKRTHNNQNYLVTYNPKNDYVIVGCFNKGIFYISLDFNIFNEETGNAQLDKNATNIDEYFDELANKEAPVKSSPITMTEQDLETCNKILEFNKAILAKLQEELRIKNAEEDAIARKAEEKRQQVLALERQKAKEKDESEYYVNQRPDFNTIKTNPIIDPKRIQYEQETQQLINQRNVTKSTKLQQLTNIRTYLQNIVNYRQQMETYHEQYKQLTFQSRTWNDQNGKIYNIKQDLLPYYKNEIIKCNKQYIIALQQHNALCEEMFNNILIYEKEDLYRFIKLSDYNKHIEIYENKILSLDNFINTYTEFQKEGHMYILNEELQYKVDIDSHINSLNMFKNEILSYIKNIQSNKVLSDTLSTNKSYDNESFIDENLLKYMNVPDIRSKYYDLLMGYQIYNSSLKMNQTKHISFNSFNYDSFTKKDISALKLAIECANAYPNLIIYDIEKKLYAFNPKYCVYIATNNDSHIFNELGKLILKHYFEYLKCHLISLAICNYVHEMIQKDPAVVKDMHHDTCLYVPEYIFYEDDKSVYVKKYNKMKKHISRRYNDIERSCTVTDFITKIKHEYHEKHKNTCNYLSCGGIQRSRYIPISGGRFIDTEITKESTCFNVVDYNEDIIVSFPNEKFTITNYNYNPDYKNDTRYNDSLIKTFMYLLTIVMKKEDLVDEMNKLVDIKFVIDEKESLESLKRL